jgi:hypothetical protein
MSPLLSRRRVGGPFRTGAPAAESLWLRRVTIVCRVEVTQYARARRIDFVRVFCADTLKESMTDWPRPDDRGRCPKTLRRVGERAMCEPIVDTSAEPTEQPDGIECALRDEVGNQIRVTPRPQEPLWNRGRTTRAGEAQTSIPPVSCGGELD